MAPRIGYLPLLVGLIKPYFGSSLPPGVDTIWFEYKGLPLKWYFIYLLILMDCVCNRWIFGKLIPLVFCRYTPTGVLFDLLCPEPERPWNLTVSI